MVAGARSKGRPNLKEAAEIDLAIREAAMKVLREQGGAATLNAVAQVAGLSRKSVYARYPNKGQLFVEVIRADLGRVTGLQYDRTGNAQERLFHYVQAALELVATPGAQAIQHLLAVDPAYFSALRSEMLDATRKLFLLPLVDLLRDAMEREEFVLDEPEAMARVLLSMIFASRFAAHEDADPEAARVYGENYASFITNLVVRGLLPRG